MAVFSQPSGKAFSDLDDVVATILVPIPSTGVGLNNFVLDTNPVASGNYDINTVLNSRYTKGGTTPWEHPSITG